MYPEAKSVGLWLRHGWFIAVAYVLGFFVMLAILGWNPDAPHKKRVDQDTSINWLRPCCSNDHSGIRPPRKFLAGLSISGWPSRHKVEGDGDAYA